MSSTNLTLTVGTRDNIIIKTKNYEENLTLSEKQTQGNNEIRTDQEGSRLNCENYSTVLSRDRRLKYTSNEQ